MFNTNLELLHCVKGRKLKILETFEINKVVRKELALNNIAEIKSAPFLTMF